MNPELVNKNHVLQAITEFDRLGRDAFLKKYDFGKSKQYLLLHKEKTYDSKPIYGVAHGFATGQFLTHQDFSGGIAAAAGYLQNIGFEISKERSNTITPSAPSHTRNQKWSREEVILALDVYMRYGPIGEKHPALQGLSTTLRKRTDLTKVASPEKYRNFNGAKMKLANFLRLDPGYEGVGLKRGGQLEEEIWNEFAGDQERLSILASQLRSKPNKSSQLSDDNRSVRITDVEQVHTPEYSVIGSSDEKIPTRREQKMVLAFRDYLSSKGHVVKQHVYGNGQSAMRCDLFDETSRVLYEAKGTSHRMSIRLAIGQLFDYRRFEDKEPRLAILIPGRPNDEIVDLCNALTIEIVWPVGDSFTSTNNSI